MKIPFFTGVHQNQRVREKLNQRLEQVINSGAFILGKEVKELEAKIADFTGAKHAIGVANGSDALFLAVQALRLDPGSEVITTPFTFFASTACITRNQLKPVFVDVDPDTFNINPDLIEEAINGNTKAILPVDLFAQMADYTKITAIAKKHDLKVVEDSAESFGMSWRGVNAGLAGDVGIYSFFPTKTLGAFGDAGMVVTDDDELADYIRLCRAHGAKPKYFHKYVGINSRLDEMQAAILNIKMESIDEDIAERAQIAAFYNEYLLGIDEVKLPQIANGAQPVWYVFNIQCGNRDRLQAHLKAKGIGTSVYYPKPMHTQECFADLGYKLGDFPVAEALCEKALALPIYIGMSENECEYVAKTIREFYNK